jgi:hypothetical protein
MMSENKKTSLEKALLEAKEIEQAAVKSAKKILEESVISKIEEAVKETVLDIEKKSLKESVSIEVDSDDVSLEVKDGVTTINVEDAEEEDLKITSKESEEDLEGMDNEEESEDDLEDMEDEEEDELFEVFNLFEEEAPVEEAPAEEAPAEEVPVEGGEEEMDFDLEGGEETIGGDETAEVVTKAGYDTLSQKLDDILSKLSAAEEVVASAEPEVEVAATETSDETIAPEGEVEIVDDEETVQQATPAEETPAEEAPVEGGEEEVVSEDDEIEIDDIINELMGEIALDENEDDLDFEFEDEDESLEEIIGLGHGVQRAFGHDRDRNANRHRAPVSNLHINENIAHQEAKLAELTKENESLKESLREYKESFKVLRKQINEVQTFNAKLAYVNKLFSKGGLTNDEKVQIAESFDNVETIEEAKSLYNKIINENTTLSEGKTEQLKSKLKSKNPAVVSTKTEALYESTEVSRMKQLAGIRTLNN